MIFIIDSFEFFESENFNVHVTLKPNKPYVNVSLTST